MPVMIAPTPSDAPVGQQKKSLADEQASVPFARASKYHIEQGNAVSGVVINTPSPGTFNFTLPSYGYLAAVMLTFAASGGTGAVAVYYEDSPWSQISQIIIQDVNGVPIYQLGGYQAFLASKFGGYRLFGPDISTALYGAVTSLTTGAGLGAIGNTPLFLKGNSGNYVFTLPLYFEFGRDGLGNLANMDASARYNVQITLNTGTASATGPVYTTAPTSYPTLAMMVEVLCRSQPPQADLFGTANTITPPAAGTIQYWSQQAISGLTGAQTIQLTRVGNLIRGHYLVFRDTANGTRATAELSDMPILFEFDWDSIPRYISNVSTLRQFFGDLVTGYDYPLGVIGLPNTTDPDKLAISEFGDEWMQTVGASKLTLRFTPLASCSLIVLTNDFVPASGQVYAAPMLQGGY